MLTARRYPGPFALAIIGGGPRATYALERLAATARGLPQLSLTVHIFEKTGEFGAGQVHSPSQPPTSVLNRVASQISFAVDESLAAETTVRPRNQRQSLYEWSRDRFETTGNPIFDIQPDDWPGRHLHGLALRDHFTRYIGELEAIDGVSVRLHHDEVVDVADLDGRWLVVRARNCAVTVDQVLLVTGHSNRAPASNVTTLARIEFARKTGAQFTCAPYPIAAAYEALPSISGSTIALEGTGLTAIDHIPFLTENRGGRFIRDIDDCVHYQYQPNGREPALIIATSPSGTFPFTRPDNAKQSREDEHESVFLTSHAIDVLRSTRGSRQISGRQPGRSPRSRTPLDFEADLLPLITLEMAYLYYETLFGTAASARLRAAALDRYEAFLGEVDRPAHWHDSTQRLVEPIEDEVDRIARAVERSLATAEQESVDVARAAELGRAADADITEHWLTVVTGDPRIRTPPRESPWGHETTSRGNRFDWRALLQPAPPADEAAFRDDLARDVRWSRQGNLTNPHKAALDGVWRDCRDILGQAIDHGGLTAASHRTFTNVYLRLNNKFVNGNSRQCMEKMLALVDAGVLRVTRADRTPITADESRARFVISEQSLDDQPAQLRVIDVLVEARVASFDGIRDEGPLYPTMIARGLLRPWTNNSEGESYSPGYLALDSRRHPVDLAGLPDRRIVVCGAAAALTGFFPFSAMRPDRNHPVMREMHDWVDEFWSAYASQARTAATTIARPSTQRTISRA